MESHGKAITLRGSRKSESGFSRKRKPKHSARKRWSANWNGFACRPKDATPKGRHASILMKHCSVRRTNAGRKIWKFTFRLGLGLVRLSSRRIKYRHLTR